MTGRRKLNHWDTTLTIMREAEFEMIVAVRLSLVPIGVEILHAGDGWAFVWMELPSGFSRPDATAVTKP